MQCRNASDMLGFTEDELLSRSIMDIHPTDELPSVLQTFHALVDGKQRIGHDIPMLRKDGSVFHADVTHNEIELNGRRCTVGLLPRRTERNRAEEALRQSHDELKAIYDGMVDGLHILNLRTQEGGSIKSRNVPHDGIFQGRNIVAVQAEAHPPEELPEILERFQAHVEGRVSRWRPKFPCSRKDGSVSLCRYHCKSDSLQRETLA